LGCNAREVYQQYSRKLKTFALFKTVLDSIGSEFPEEAIDHAILAFHKRLTAFVEVNG